MILYPNMLGKRTRSATSIWWSLTQKAWVRPSRMSVIKWELRFTSRCQHHQGSVDGPKDVIISKGGVIYRYKCDHLGCTVEYIGEIWSTFGDRYKEHLGPAYPPLSITIKAPWVIPSNLTISPSWTGSPRCHQDHRGGHVHQSQQSFPKQ